MQPDREIDVVAEVCWPLSLLHGLDFVALDLASNQPLYQILPSLLVHILSLQLGVVCFVETTT